MDEKKKDEAGIGTPLFLDPGAYRERSGARPATAPDEKRKRPPPRRVSPVVTMPTPVVVIRRPEPPPRPLLRETQRQPGPMRWFVPSILFVLTCASTWSVGARAWPAGTMAGPLFSASLMGILLAHEFGHFLVARYYGVPASPPFFIPMPISPIGTMGAVIAMRPHSADRKALYDIAVAGPLAGLVPTFLSLIAGLHLSELSWNARLHPPWLDGRPILFTIFETVILGPPQPGQGVDYHPLAVAAWTGLLITALNLFPIGQLDGGHVLYTLLGQRAHLVSRLILFACAAVVILSEQYRGWIIMVVLLLLMGRHPPTADDTVPLGRWRIVVGWALLAFVVVGFTPSPFG